MQITVSVPGLLRDCTQGRRRFAIEAGTLREALERLLETYPLLRVHLYDEDESLRPHVLIYYNDDNLARLEQLDVPLKAGDRLQILQAVSGG